MKNHWLALAERRKEVAEAEAFWKEFQIHRSMSKFVRPSNNWLSRAKAAWKCASEKEAKLAN